MKNNYIIGQRWISESEPELGLGVIAELLHYQVSISFPGSGEKRTYSTDSPPILRLRFNIGDTLRTATGETHTVRGVREVDGLLVYRTDSGEIPESDLSSAPIAPGAFDRLLQGRTDESTLFDLRLRMQQQRRRLQSSPARGFAGGRISLIPHQLHVASEVAHRPIPRVLLADEVGLGKTIEACLILHHLLISKRISRILILVPEALVHQWFIELLRRFSLKAAIYDEERCLSISRSPEGGNPFLDEQLIIAPIPLLSSNEEHCTQACEAGWDLVVIDEAHHLGWSPELASPEYLVAEKLARATSGLLLLTATPEEIGPESHFARLRLLDPDRYSDLDAYLAESKGYHQLCPIAEKLVAEEMLTRKEEALLEKLGIPATDSPATRLRAVLDRYGPGRAVFRNTRRQMKNFPLRQAHLHPLPPGGKVPWLADFLRKNPKEKILLITHDKAEVIALEEKLSQHISAKIALFHESMSLLQRDRSAAWFSETEGAQILLASEIGGEGRNFQFAHLLVLFDLPENPEILEQRIGRLDRIGQTNTIEIHVPFVETSRDATLAHWFHKGLDAFQTPLHGGHEIYAAFHPRLGDENLELNSPEWEELLEETRTFRDKLEARLLHGLDRLLELQSCDEHVAKTLRNAIQSWDKDHELEHTMVQLLDHYGVQVEPMSRRTYCLHPDRLFCDTLPIPLEGITVTFDREKALAREDYSLLSWDHPIVTGAMEMLLSSLDGSAAAALWPGGGGKALLLEAIFLLEVMEVRGGRAHRFLPATPIRMLVDHDGKLCKTDFSPEDLHEGSSHPVFAKLDLLRQLVPHMRQAAETEAEAHTQAHIKAALQQLETEAEQEIQRLKALQKRNSYVSEKEIEALGAQIEATRSAISAATLRLDSARLIWRTPK